MKLYDAQHSSVRASGNDKLKTFRLSVVFLSTKKLFTESFCANCMMKLFLNENIKKFSLLAREVSTLFKSSLGSCFDCIGKKGFRHENVKLTRSFATFGMLGLIFHRFSKLQY